MHSSLADRVLERRRGFTVAELVVALTVGGIVLGAFALTVARQERAHAELARRVRARAQLREGLAALVTDLRSVAPEAGDLARAHALDSSIELRTTIGSAVICWLAGRTVTAALASFVTHPSAGDTAWAYVAGDSAAWTPLPIQRAVVLPAHRAVPCRFPPRAAAAVRGEAAQDGWYALDLSDTSSAMTPGTPLRVTRRARYSLYRAPDSRWYLGRREWSAARGRFETIQPVSGPYRPYAPRAKQTSGLELHYFDSAGVTVSSGTPASDRVARVSIVLRAGAGGPVQERRDAIQAMATFRSPP